MIKEDIVDGYLSVERARKDHGVVIEPVNEELCEYRIDQAATRRERNLIRARRIEWAPGGIKPFGIGAPTPQQRECPHAPELQVRG